MRLKTIRKMCAVLMCGAMVGTSVLPTLPVKAAEEETTIKVEYPGEGKDASPAVKEAIEEAAKVDGPVTLEFEEGKQYEIYPETAYHEMNYYISNAATKAENPNGERWSAMFMKGMEDVTVEGNEALLNIHGVMTPLLLDECKNIKFQNLHIDWARPTMSELDVIEVGDTYAKMKVGDGSLYKIENNGTKFRWVSEEKPDGGYYWTLEGGLVAHHNAKENTLTRSGFSYPQKWIDEGEGILRLEYASRPNLTVGDNWQFRSGSRDQVGSFIHKSENIEFENMGFHYMHGLGVVAQYTKNISFRNVDCTPREETGRKCASSADFMQVSGCSGLVSITDSKFSGAHDDVFNVHGTHLRIVRKDESANKIVVRFMQERSWGFQAFDIGDEIEFVKPDTMLCYASNKVKDFKRLDDYEIELTLEEALPGNIGLNADVVENITATPDVVIKGNYADNITTRGVLCTTRGKVLIEDNTFYKNGMSGVLLEDDVRAWYESGPIRDMTIKNNRFIQCGGPQIFSNPQTSVYDPAKTVHANIKIIENEFTGYATIRMLSTRDVVIENNIFKNGGAIELSACNGFAISGNEGANKPTASNSLNDKSFASFRVQSQETIEEIDRNGMSASSNSERGGYPASNLLDGNIGTIWHTDWDNVPAELPYIELDLNGAKTFNRLSYMPRQGENGGNITGYEVLVKEHASDEEFLRVAEGTWSSNSSEKQIDLENSVTAEVIRLVATDSVFDSSGRRIASGAEIKLQNVAKNADSIPTNKKIKLAYEALGETGVLADLSEAKFTYSSDNAKVATVAEDGTITGVSAGKATITVTVEAYQKTMKDSAVITVTEDVYHAAESIEILEPNGNQMQVRILPEEAAEDVAWSVERMSGGTPTISEDGVLTISEAGRMKVTAYSKNDSSVKDEKIFIATSKGEKEEEYVWVRENKNNWSLNQENGLELTLENGALWSGTTNTAKNILLKDAGKDDFTLITKMNYKPQNDYAESGIAYYVDDDNYVYLSRKKHSGYGGNIFSVITESAGNPQESPADVRVSDPLEGEEVYLKLEKTGNQYSGYYSADGIDWKPVWENRTVDLGEAPKAAIVGYGKGNEKATYHYLQIDDEKYTFETLIPGMDIQKGLISAIHTSLSIEGIVGMPADELNLPKDLQVTWNESYQDMVQAEWDLSEYNEMLGEGTYMIPGTLKDIPSENISEDVKVAVSLHLAADETDPTADKSDIEALIEYAKSQQMQADYKYLVPVVKQAFEKALADAETVKAKADATQAEVDAAYDKLLKMVHYLEFTGNSDSLKVLVDAADGLNEKLYTKESWAVLADARTEARKVLDDENALQDEIDAARDALRAAMDALVEITVDTSRLQKLVDSSQKYKDKLDQYTPSTVRIFEGALKNAGDVLAKEDVTQEEIDAAYAALQNAIFGLREIPNKDKLDELLGKVKAMDLSVYSEATASAVRAAYAQAVAVFEDENADETAVKEAVSRLEESLKNLEAKTDGTEDKTNTEKNDKKTDKTASAGTKVKTENNDKKSAQTGDSTNVMVWFVMMFMTGIVFFSKRKSCK